MPDLNFLFKVIFSCTSRLLSAKLFIFTCSLELPLHLHSHLCSFPLDLKLQAEKKHQCLLQTDPTFLGGIIAGWWQPAFWQFSVEEFTLSRPEGRSRTRGVLFPSFDIHEVVRHDFSPRDDTDSTEFYCNVLSHWGRKYCKKNLNFCATVPQWPKVLWGKKDTIFICYQLYKPDLPLCNFILFSWNKNQIEKWSLWHSEGLPGEC